MSAWYVWSALGMYPVTPGSDQLILGTPLFDRAIVIPKKDSPLAKSLTIRKSGAGIYIRNAHIEENELPTHITKDAMRDGGTLVFECKTNQSDFGPGCRQLAHRTMGRKWIYSCSGHPCTAHLQNHVHRLRFDRKQQFLSHPVCACILGWDRNRFRKMGGLHGAICC